MSTSSEAVPASARAPIQPPTLADLPAPPSDKTGWPWTEVAPPLPPTMPSAPFAVEGSTLNVERATLAAWPRISIVTPSYGQAQYLEETIRSVLLQGYPNLEYFVVDGGSTDGSVAIIEKYAPWLAWWCSEPDVGQSDALNKGFARATGQVLAYLNSDDFYYPGALAAAAICLGQNSAAALVHSDCHLVDEASRIMKTVITGARPACDLLTLLRHESWIMQQTAFWRRSAWEAADATFATDLHYVMDGDLWLRFALLGLPMIGCSPSLEGPPARPGVNGSSDSAWAAFRVTPQQKSFSHQKMALERSAIIARACEHADKVSPSVKDAVLRHADFELAQGYCAAGQLDQAAACFRRALAGRRFSRHEINAMAEEIVHWPRRVYLLPLPADQTQRYCADVVAVLKRVYRPLAAEVVKVIAFMAEDAGDAGAVRREAVRALAISPYLWTDKGFWRLIIRAIRHEPVRLP